LGSKCQDIWIERFFNTFNAGGGTGMGKTRRVLSSTRINDLIKALSRLILAKNRPPESLVLIGIYNRGVPLARRLLSGLEKSTRTSIPLGTLNIALYRDDLDTVGHKVIVKATDINFDLTDKNVILVDDVLFTGRTIRAALDELVDFGRPRSVQLAVLIDRGHRELPIQADYTGKRIKTKRNEIVQVKLRETDGLDEVNLIEPSG